MNLESLYTFSIVVRTTLEIVAPIQVYVSITEVITLNIPL